MKLSNALSENRGIGPGFHLVRHLLSVTILLIHCRNMVSYPGDNTLLQVQRPVNIGLTGGSQIATDGPGAYLEWLLSAQNLQFAQPLYFSLVGAFFALSGFLVTGSAIRNPSVRTFFANRAARIVPALSVEVALSALVLGPIVTILSLGEYFSDPQVFRYFGNILGLVTFTLPGVFVHNPWPNVVNGNLWTLPPEFWCYLLMLGLMVSGALRYKSAFGVAVLVTAIIWTTLDLINGESFSVRADTTHFSKWYIVFLFFVGCAFYLCADRIRLSLPLFLLSGAGYYLLMLFDVLTPLSGIFLTYGTIYVGFARFDWFDRAVKSDFSYGIYLYGWPLTQTVVHFLLPRLDGYGKTTQTSVIAALSLFLTVVFAGCSWRYIEKPALGVRKVLATKKVSQGK